MHQVVTIDRPSLDHAIQAWKRLLTERGFATNLLWIFEENLCFEKAQSSEGGFHAGFQTKFARVAEDALDIAYDHFCETDARIVFYRLGENRHRSVCLMLGDVWFDAKGDRQGYIRHDKWGMSFHPGGAQEIEEVADLSRWLHRIKRDRPLHEVDFCMALATIDEIKVHGRALAPYERFADQVVGQLRRAVSHVP